MVMTMGPYLDFAALAFLVRAAIVVVPLLAAPYTNSGDELRSAVIDYDIVLVPVDVFFSHCPPSFFVLALHVAWPLQPVCKQTS
jgi:hypothetical protein